MPDADWRNARSLDVLKAQIDARWPGRSKASDGTIGDPRHAREESDHNPDDNGIVRARDITHDPKSGCDVGVLFEEIRISRDPRVAYMIHNGRICSANISPWAWRTYTGSDKHTGHGHLSVVEDARADQTHSWSIGGDDMTEAEKVDLINRITARVTENVTAGLRRGAWREGFLDATLPEAFRGGPTLSTMALTLEELRARPAGQPATLDYTALAQALLAELAAR